ncbi:cofactor-independent phosphoglycerate mutase [Halosquirtibacter xylanolyticus]|uniref:cofactor-independent phosphoglycerate mutase n=1 Tax=Halosquirtibacter xylanolyticus TaxID=3374599 RepID=UPI0037487FC9|nr:cofactor-independent phosphoglycerate mutase [Prolixibacteraceae bacterium]
MKHIVILGDGMADLPSLELDNLTPLEKAHTPNMDRLTKLGQAGLFHTVPESLHPGSEVANMAVMGYDVENLYEGRGVLEAASIGVTLASDDLAFRCNLITLEDGIIHNHSAGHIGNEEAGVLIDFLNDHLADERVAFHKGVSYRHLMVIKGGDKHIHCTPPHDVPGADEVDHLPKTLKEAVASKETAALVTDLIKRSQELLASHPINLERKAKGKATAASIWPWSPGYKPQMPTLKEAYNIQKSAVISAVDLIHGIGIYAGMEVIKVDGATGLWDTNYVGKRDAAIKALETCDYVYLHIEAPDEAGHEGDAKIKIKAIEDIDEKVVGPILEFALEQKDIAIALLPDHPTPWELKTHTRDAVPFAIYHPHNPSDSVAHYAEKDAAQGAYGEVEKMEFMKLLLNQQ